MSERDVDLYLPANEKEIKQFARRLDNVVDRFSPDDVCSELKLSIVSKISDDVQRIVEFDFGYNYYDGSDEYRINITERTPIDDTWDKEVARSLLGFTNSNDESEVLEEHDMPDDFVEGYLESEVEIVFVQAFTSSIVATKTMFMNVLDSTLVSIDSMPIYHDGLTFKAKSKTLSDSENILETDAALFDIGKREADNTIVTRADLLMASKALKSVGIMHPLTKPFAGAPDNFDEVKHF